MTTTDRPAGVEVGGDHFGYDDYDLDVYEYMSHYAGYLSFNDSDLDGMITTRRRRERMMKLIGRDDYRCRTPSEIICDHLAHLDVDLNIINGPYPDNLPDWISYDSSDLEDNDPVRARRKKKEPQLLLQLLMEECGVFSPGKNTALQSSATEKEEERNKNTDYSRPDDQLPKIPRLSTLVMMMAGGFFKFDDVCHEDKKRTATSVALLNPAGVRVFREVKKVKKLKIITQFSPSIMIA
ncbi:OLC1v1023618C1 [Oldenlandia corymbosa var. corymbosa]|uniref:OLC1v1023618C1 n=1 Tax=Oldenlandia corymbosa var. corymbosa TaxID=529605 RepID=A0AAV1C0F6_OLDCO|nr:OLC1v1023618C1 [Oldenlandia corymbosa var. corymbosa]